jgi:hypothetical protein
MITDPSVAKRVSDLMLEIGDRVNESIAEIRTACPPDEFANYRRAAGAVMAEILLQVLNPLYRDHPSLRPPGLV